MDITRITNTYNFEDTCVIDGFYNLKSIIADRTMAKTITIRNCPNLQEVSFCDFTYMQKLIIENCPKLELVKNIYNRRMIDFYREITIRGNTTNLKRLFLSNVTIFTLEANKFPKLATIILDNVQEAKIDYSGIVNLRNLIITDSTITNPMNIVSNKMKKIFFHTCIFGDVRFMGTNKFLSLFKIIVVYYNKMTFDKKLTNLRELTLCPNKGFIRSDKHCSKNVYIKDRGVKMSPKMEVENNTKEDVIVYLQKYTRYPSSIKHFLENDNVFGKSYKYNHVNMEDVVFC